MTLARALAFALALAPAALTVVGCQAGGDGRGGERQACRADGTCADGLLCLSDRCVRPPPADCAAVGAHLAGFRLGNYATPEERAPVVAEYQAACDRHHVDQEQGRCLLAARDRWTAAACAPKLFPEIDRTSTSCARVVERINVLLDQQMAGGPPELAEMRAKITAVLGASCEEDRWPPALRACMLEAATADKLEACEAVMPEGLEQKLNQRIQALM